MPGAPRTIVVIVGARPNFMKARSVWTALERWQARRGSLDLCLLHTGQHYDAQMSEAFFRELRLPRPHIHLGVGSGSHAKQTAAIMVGLEEVCLERRPDLLIVFGDVNSTVAAALVAAKLCIPLAHVEAGLRSGDRTMPEEVNRIVTDVLADFCFTPSADADAHLLREGIDPSKIVRVGNVMVDTLREFLDEARQSPILAQLGLDGPPVPEYALITLHRPSNVDDPPRLTAIVEALEVLGERRPVVFPVHPRTRERLAACGLGDRLRKGGHLLDPCGYLDFLCLMSHAAVVVTDSGGVQEETTALGIPCLVLRETTERPITVSEGTGRLIGNDPARLVEAYEHALANRGTSTSRIPDLWDGLAGERIARHLEAHLDGGEVERGTSTMIKGL